MKRRHVGLGVCVVVVAGAFVWAQPGAQAEAQQAILKNAADGRAVGVVWSAVTTAEALQVQQINRLLDQAAKRNLTGQQKLAFAKGADTLANAVKEWQTQGAAFAAERTVYLGCVRQAATLYTRGNYFASVTWSRDGAASLVKMSVIANGLIGSSQSVSQTMADMKAVLIGGG